MKTAHLTAVYQRTGTRTRLKEAEYMHVGMMGVIFYSILVG